MSWILIFLWAIPSGVLWVFNAEVLVVTQVHDGQLPWLVALVTTGGQFIGYALLFAFAERVLARLGGVRRAVDRVRRRHPAWGDTPGWPTYSLFVMGGLMGLPPLLALFAIMGSAHKGRLLPYLLAAAPTRFIWYLGWAYAPGLLRDAFGWFTDA
ncbi:MAG: hypothetical protein CSA66_03650 [Proteobacteria bacterium]|nr:MAG: hypothetical protein CSA66_03650 [Pseudomonadota bacterium]